MFFVKETKHKSSPAPGRSKGKVAFLVKKHTSTNLMEGQMDEFTSFIKMSGKKLSLL